MEEWVGRGNCGRDTTGKDSLPAALFGEKLAGPLPLIKGDSFFVSRAGHGKPGL